MRNSRGTRPPTWRGITEAVMLCCIDEASGSLTPAPVAATSFRGINRSQARYLFHDLLQLGGAGALALRAFIKAKKHEREMSLFAEVLAFSRAHDDVPGEQKDSKKSLKYIAVSIALR
ncbi:hypothetical protein NQ042_12565 [Corynebacterium phoceense]|uniref:hypothetical protein n=1 Tax=Corynebacterium phoceense TaxID=1686286 RepID=UPI00211BE22E|nr:hypothetical protein [Corynebacterium phoceense]MCQ9334897.1 hypothetical protein [Corynebacterium phoceense]